MLLHFFLSPTQKEGRLRYRFRYVITHQQAMARSLLHSRCGCHNCMIRGKLDENLFTKTWNSTSLPWNKGCFTNRNTSFGRNNILLNLFLFYLPHFLTFALPKKFFIEIIEWESVILSLAKQTDVNTKNLKNGKRNYSLRQASMQGRTG
jgi:hypothetical protein